jgi:hypothetical protein
MIDILTKNPEPSSRQFSAPKIELWEAVLDHALVIYSPAADSLPKNGRAYRTKRGSGFNSKMKAQDFSFTSARFSTSIHRRQSGQCYNVSSSMESGRGVDMKNNSAKSAPGLLAANMVRQARIVLRHLPQIADGGHRSNFRS